jgi:hypothetical protein
LVVDPPSRLPFTGLRSGQEKSFFFWFQFKTSLCGKMLKTQLGVFVILAVFLLCSCVVDSRAATDEQLEGKVTRKRKGRTSTIVIKVPWGHNTIVV